MWCTSTHCHENETHIVIYTSAEQCCPSKRRSIYWVHESSASYAIVSNSLLQHNYFRIHSLPYQDNECDVLENDNNTNVTRRANIFQRIQNLQARDWQYEGFLSLSKPNTQLYSYMRLQNSILPPALACIRWRPKTVSTGFSPPLFNLNM